MNKSLTILISLATALLLNCGVMQGKDKTDNSGLLAILTAGNSNSTTNANCKSTTLDGIANKYAYVTNPSRTQYKISGCGLSDISAINFTANEITTGATGTSSNSQIVSNGNNSIDQARGGTNVEVTFKLNGSSGSLDVISYGTGTSPSISGPTFRLTAGSLPQFKKVDGTFGNVSKGSATTTTTLAADTSYTYCLDFQYTSAGKNYMNGWEKPCSEVTSTERGSMMYYPIMVMMNVPAYTSGSKIGFVLNNATVTSFTVGTILSETE